MGLSMWARGRKASNPGPGRYTIPDDFSSGPKYTLKGRIKQRDPDPEPPIRSMGSTLNKKGSSFGYSGYTPKPFITPSPDYTPPAFGSDAKKVSFRFRQPLPPNENPGPADYSVSRALSKNGITIGEGKRWDAIDPNSYSSPADHPVPRSCPEEFPRKIGNFIPRPKPKRYGPGPAKYNMETNIVAANTPITIGDVVMRGEKPSDNPGPADYQRIRELRNETAVPINMKGRPPLPHGDICDYPYHKLPSTLERRNITIGDRPETSYETPGPGPSYKAPSTLSDKGATVGKRTPLYDPAKGIPGPGAYFKMPPTEKPMPFSGFLGPDTRSPINEKENANLPGPGDYLYPRELDKFERGYYFTSRMMNQFIPDTDAPFHDPMSTLGGPKFTIGNKEEF